ncbi:SDR family NAD(P)-dependent oxidoreductase, partial [Arenibacter lacus]|uniref:SDR family NAD(P)-dependent oxidoreductase n=1 Tax=Arenibacter lacus TaxID=2608629 RepID=UPI00123E3BC0
MRLKEKTILITGGYTGIGLAIARRCVAEGAKVMVNGLDEDLGKTLVEELGAENASIFTIDITNPQAPQKLVAETLRTYGKLDAVVNNAALIGSSNINTTDISLMERMLAVNTIAPLAIIQAALPHLSKVRG